ncbi:MAG TPA: hydrogenase 4 subunit B, partial [Ktedonobacter sp.]|nr:hydrogenase 4 subunit B [Ktedonobacter sp.]
MNWNLLPTFAFWTMLGLYSAGSILSLLLRRERASTSIAALCASLGCTAALLCGAGILAGASSPMLALDTNLPFGVLSVHLDRLSAFFLSVIGLVSLPITLYSVGYLRLQTGMRVRTFGMLLNLLLLSLVLTVSAADMIVFLIAWEAMSFLSAFAVIYTYEEQRTVRSGYTMLAISEIGTIGILVAFLLLYQASGSFNYEGLRLGSTLLSVPLRSVVFLCAFFGFGAKVGILPLQFWMPDAYHAAPDHISALLSGVLVNLGIYGLARFLLDFLGNHGAIPSWWGLFALALGAVMALIGILYAVVQQDLKRILAYSSIENMGILLASLGATLTFWSYHLIVLAAIAALVTLYHMLNHAAYKSLLFLCAGSVQRATGSSELAKLGGLIRLMPWTALFFILAALAISAVPPLNGYISEWMLLETLLQSFAIPDTFAKIVIAFSGGLLALTAAIAVTAFVRASAVTFLALPHSKDVASAQESPLSMRFAMGFLALLCTLLGILPTFVLPVLDRVTTPLLGRSVLNQVVPPLFTNHPGDYQALVTLG